VTHSVVDSNINKVKILFSNAIAMGGQDGVINPKSRLWLVSSLKNESLFTWIHNLFTGKVKMNLFFSIIVTHMYKTLLFDLIWFC